MTFIKRCGVVGEVVQTMASKLGADDVTIDAPAVPEPATVKPRRKGCGSRRKCLQNREERPGNRRFSFVRGEWAFTYSSDFTRRKCLSENVRDSILEDHRS